MVQTTIVRKVFLSLCILCMLTSFALAEETELLLEISDPTLIENVSTVAVEENLSSEVFELIPVPEFEQKPFVLMQLDSNPFIYTAELIPDAFLAQEVIATETPFAIENNEYIIKARDLKAKAETAFEYGDYDSSADLAAQAEEYFILSNQFIDAYLVQVESEKLIAQAEEAKKKADDLKASVYFPLPYKQGTESLDAAKASYDTKEYAKAKAEAEAALSAFKLVSAKPELPSVYVVRKLTKSDCFWRIAGYSWIYNDPTKWTKIYEANRKKLVDPANPNLIHPGLKLTIPSLRGETRSGTFDPNKDYPNIDEIAPKKK